MTQYTQYNLKTKFTLIYKKKQHFQKIFFQTSFRPKHTLQAFYLTICKLSPQNTIFKKLLLFFIAQLHSSNSVHICPQKSHLKEKINSRMFTKVREDQYFFQSLNFKLFSYSKRTYGLGHFSPVVDPLDIQNSPKSVAICETLSIRQSLKKSQNNLDFKRPLS